MSAKLFKREVDLSNGPIFKRLIAFAIPMVLTSILQLLFNATDIAVLKMMVNENAVAAVGATSALVSLLINFFIGLSSGSNVVLARCVGENNLEKSRRIVGTAISMSLISGIFLAIVGYFCSELFLTWMGCPKELLDGATKYMQIYFIGMPIVLFYNFSASLLRAVGDSLRPLIYLAISGVVNVGLNVLFIAVFNMTVEGVAIGTVGSQLIASVLAFIAMKKSTGFSKFEFKRFRIYKKELSAILKVGVPSGVQSILFALSNVLISSNVNSFGTQTIAGNTGGHQIDGFVYVTGNAIAQANMAFVSQNYGAGKADRIKKSIIITILTACTAQLIVGLFAFAFSRPLTSIFIETEAAYQIARLRLIYIGVLYFIAGAFETLAYAMRALDKSVVSMVVTLIFVCFFRIFWLNTFFLLNPTITMIYISYPISWLLSFSVLLIFLIPHLKKIERKLKEERTERAEKTA